VIQLTGYHYHNDDFIHRTATFVQETLAQNLREKKVKVIDHTGATAEIPIKELGIGYPVILTTQSDYRNTQVVDSNGTAIDVKRWDFTLQFAWQETPPSKRLEKKTQPQAGQAAPELAGGAP
jgi:hypothetical protein